MDMKTNLLNVKRVKAINKPGKFCDGGGLYLQVSPALTKSWFFRYTLAGVTRDFGLGPVDATRTLEEARKLARELRQKVQQGISPHAEKEARTIAERGRITFEQAVREWHPEQRAKWKRERDWTAILTSFETYAFPELDKLPVDTIDTHHVESVLKPIWNEKQESASRLRGNIESVLDWSTVRKYRKGDNPARWGGCLEHLFSRTHKVQHLASMPYENLPTFMAKLRAHNTMAARALEFAILTGGRTKETIGAMWSEIDLDAALWTIPEGRMKKGVEHIVPLPPQAVALLRSMPRINDYVFPGRDAGRCVGNNAMRDTMQRQLGATETVHGFRSSFRTWGGNMGYRREVMEAAIAHKLRDQAERAYNRSNYLDERRTMMSAWANHCDGTQADNIIPMRA
jgi:integrase